MGEAVRGREPNPHSGPVVKPRAIRGVWNTMRHSGMRSSWMGAALLTGAALVLSGAPAGAADDGGRLYAVMARGDARPGLGAGTAPEPRWGPSELGGVGGARRGRSVSPAVAGFLSALVPGAGQLIQGQSRGWAYLGVEGAAWFSVLSLHDAGNQAETDYRAFAGDPNDTHSRWAFHRYETVTDCGEGLGPVDFESESEAIHRVYVNARDDYFDEIGRLNVYACGWTTQADRARYLGMRSHADALFSSARWVVGAMFLNHVVSAVDAAKSASNRRKAEAGFSWDWRVAPTPRGDLAFNMELSRRF